MKCAEQVRNVYVRIQMWNTIYCYIISTQVPWLIGHTTVAEQPNCKSSVHNYVRGLATEPFMHTAGFLFPITTQVGAWCVRLWLTKYYQFCSDAECSPWCKWSSPPPAVPRRDSTPPRIRWPTSASGASPTPSARPKSPPGAAAVARCPGRRTRPCI